MSFEMIKQGYPMDKEIMLEDEYLMIDEDNMEGITSCKVS